MMRSGTATAPAGTLTLADYAALARRRMPADAWALLEGGPDEERSLRANRAAFDRVRLRPRVLAGLDRHLLPETETRILGRTWAAPVAVAALGRHTLAHPDGEVATAAAAAAAGVPFVVSSLSGRTLEDIAAAATGGLWLQLHSFHDRLTIRRLVRRAESAGFEALVLTSEAPRPGGRGPGTAGPVVDPALLTWLRSVTPLPLLVHGVLTADEARLAVDAGANGIVVSNHAGRPAGSDRTRRRATTGGRATDDEGRRTGDGGHPPGTAALDALPEIAAAVGGACPVLLDGGVRRGGDVLAALALGADAVLLGRPVLHGLAVGRGEGVTDVLDILIDELTDAMTLTGIGSVADADPGLVSGSAGEGAARPAHTTRLLKEELHASVSDPVLDTMNFLNEITHRYPEAISFAPGRPYDGFFDTGELLDHIRRYLDHLADSGHSPARIRDAMFQYGPTAGRIRELIADSLRKDENVDVPPESVVVTVGAQEAMLLTLRALVSGPDDVLLVSSPCYVGITGAARLLDIEVVPVEEGEHGFDHTVLDAVIRAEKARGRRPRAFYVIPDHSNPSGITMRLEERHALLDLAARHDLIVLEDSPYRMVSPGRQLPVLKSLDRAHTVVHLGSFSKTLFPGARVGFAVADQLVVDRTGRTGLLADELTKIKSMVTVNTSPLSQAAVGGMLLAADGRTADLNTATSAYYGKAMRDTLDRLDACFPEPARSALGVRWNRPGGGFFLAVHVPFRADNAALVRSAEEYGVIWTPMSYFYPRGGGDHALRLSVSYLTEAEITEGIGRLARFIRAESATP